MSWNKGRFNLRAGFFDERPAVWSEYGKVTDAYLRFSIGVRKCDENGLFLQTVCADCRQVNFSHGKSEEIRI